MTHRPIRTEPDGTRVYADYHRYRPKPDAERKYRRRKPDDPRAVRFGGRWFLPLELVDEAARVLPETQPDETAYEHMERRVGCSCPVCRRPAATRWQRRWRWDQGLR